MGFGASSAWPSLGRIVTPIRIRHARNGAAHCRRRKMMLVDDAPSDSEEEKTRMHPPDHGAVSALLARAGCVASDEEASELIDAAEGDGDRLAELIRRRVSGEPT